MAQDYIILNEEQDYGKIAINKSVFQSIADISVSDIENVVLPASKSKKVVTVKIDKENRLLVEADLTVKYGCNVNTTCGVVQTKIYENILFMTGFKASEITVNVIGFAF